MNTNRRTKKLERINQMKKRMGILIVIAAMVIMAGILMAEQVWLDPGLVGFVTDPNQTAGRLIVAVRIEADADVEFSHAQEIEPHPYPVTITYAGIPAGSRIEGATFYWQPTQLDIGTHYFSVTAMDEPPFYISPKAVTGVWAVQVVPNNPGPVLIPFAR